MESPSITYYASLADSGLTSYHPSSGNGALLTHPTDRYLMRLYT
ncbi:hypothetical protein ACE1CI_17135 [Aerosakkonemataceae cyanobacterium BLCC-F50]|uniref:Uncharacterized protein n=1 Tax=Floridaenema flaviceps BLCC-F50 TaxID=3153642 RepID=A0ABV4XSG7_9CYAN